MIHPLTDRFLRFKIRIRDFTSVSKFPGFILTISAHSPIQHFDNMLSRSAARLLASTCPRQLWQVSSSSTHRSLSSSSAHFDSGDDKVRSNNDDINLSDLDAIFKDLHRVEEEYNPPKEGLERESRGEGQGSFGMDGGFSRDMRDEAESSSSLGVLGRLGAKDHR